MSLYEFFDTGSMRTAKNEDGKTYYVPADMTYREWEKKLVVQRPPITSIRMLPDLKNSTDDVEGLKTKIAHQVI